ncbi:CDP-alcohol phosphatidyltransferase family protein [uncultured Flavobacterium sp.]|uniref:CDP-alcohol phosphatidyltransferase family protein n=1 Tax=uncultured Flavobacterium sp. TaxID=165435 RepID=UPI0025D66BF4|nr:CDP-alcohol phosphatidyltransferase family protein [uncultured Flavobacterium sp.]
MKNIPIGLIYSRLIIGFIIIILSILNIENLKFYTVFLLTTGLLTDIFDGIIARKLNISTQKLRRLDSSIDQVFFVCVIASTYIQCPGFFQTNSLQFFILIGIESLTYAVCYLKFKKEIATHSIGAKIWTLVLFATLIQVILKCESQVLFAICFWLGILTRLEIIAIIFTLKNWTNDVPSFYHALKLRQGKDIKRNRLFNG